MVDKIVLKKGLKLGELDAEADIDLLKSCFMDNGVMNRLLDVNDHAAIILGRTGSGKSALLLQIKERTEHSCFLNPHNISIRFLENSNIIQFLNELGIKLQLFYKILWRHILIVELLKMRYNLHNESDSIGLIRNITNAFSRDKAKQKAFEYFVEWGDKFWLEVDEQLRELTEKVVRDIKFQLGNKYNGIELTLEGAKSLSEEQRTEILPRAKKAVDEIQIQKLNDVFGLLAEHAFQDKQKVFYILIDQLDEDWAESETQYSFIRALIDEIKSFKKLPQVKIIVALRQDLLDIVFDKTRDRGFQEEKYEAYFLPLKWSKHELDQLIELRICEVFRRQYTKNNVKFLDIFPSAKGNGKGASFDYIVERTLLRPRDVLQFINECFIVSSDNNRVSWKSIYSAEATYSSKRLKSLQEEWGEIYPAFKETVNILRGMSSSFIRSDIGGDKLATICLTLNDLNPQDSCVKACKKFYSPSDSMSESEVIADLLRCFYHVGIIGVKISTIDGYIWSYINQPLVSKSEIKRTNRIEIHKMIWHALEIKS